MLGLMTQDYLEREVYCCGPESFMEGVREMLISLGYDMENYHQESYAAPAESRQELTDSTTSCRTRAPRREILFVEFGRHGKLHRDRHGPRRRAIVRAQHPVGLHLRRCAAPARSASARARCTWSTTAASREEDIAEGYILACCSNPIGTVEVEV